MNNVAVYGTLLKGLHNHLILASDTTKFIGDGLVKGFDMYDLGSFPAIIKGEGDVVVEVYNVDDHTMSKLDMLEGYHGPGSRNNLYNKETAFVDMWDPENGEEYSIVAEIYVFNKVALGKGFLKNSSYIESGNYKKHLRDKEGTTKRDDFRKSIVF